MQPLHNKLPLKAKKVWLIYSAITILITLLIFAAVTYAAVRFDWPIYIMVIIGAVILILSIISLTLEPKIRWNILSYEVREHEIEIQSGLFIVKRTIIPTIRIQHVDVEQGPILKRMRLANIDITTAATTHTIPLLNESDADELRLKISELARVAKEDV